MLTLILITAGYVDLKRRKIPLSVILLLFIYAVIFSTIPVFERICGFVLTALPLFILALLTDKLKGGDVKFLAVLAAGIGMRQMAWLLGFTTLYAVVYSIVKKEKSVPLAFCVLLGWITISGIRLV